MSRRIFAAAVVTGLLAAAPLLEAQLPRPLGPRPENGLRVAPFFDGWYENPDGTISFAFGYSNLNKDAVHIPLGPDNSITPKEYDGRQPTWFEPMGPAPARTGGRGAGARGGAGTGATDPGAGTDPAAAGGGGGRGGGGGGDNNYQRERGVFTVTVPKTFKGDVVWTLKYQGQTWSIPARSKSGAYQLSWPMAMGSTPPLLRFQPNGPGARGPMGLQGPQLQAKVGVPVDLTVWLTDDAKHDPEPIPVKREAVPSMNVTWIKHSGPAAPVVFSTPKEGVTDSQGKATTKVTFSEAGEYTLRVRADTFGNTDSSFADQCCWTNGYWKVAVTR